MSAKQNEQLSSKKRHKRLAYGKNYIPEEETIRNDYSLNYVLTGSRPSNHIQNTALETRFAEYPKLKKLSQLKRSLVASHAHPPTYIQADLRTDRPNSFNLLDLSPARFDVILIDPPLEEYVETYPDLPIKDPSISGCGGPKGEERDFWNWEELESLPLPQIAASPGFIFLWCGSGQGSTLERGRALLSRWGYRKCEDLVWIKTNHTQIGKPQPKAIPAIFTPTKEHCLMGIRGTVRRSTDGHFVHCNVDTDVIVSEPDPTDILHKPEELYHLIENFCLGRRRLELFGSSRNLRPGWLTIGTDCAPSPTSNLNNPIDHQEEMFNREQNQPVAYSRADYLAHFLDSAGRTHNLLPSHADIDNLRPRSPPSRITTSAIGGNGIGQVGIGYPSSNIPGGIPIIGAGGAILATTISGRNTISHPSGGLGRGPGNALLPGMRVSGLRDSSNNNLASHQSRNPNSTHQTFVHPNQYPFPYYPHPSWPTGHTQFFYQPQQPQQHYQQQQQHYQQPYHYQAQIYSNNNQAIYYPQPTQTFHQPSINQPHTSQHQLDPSAQAWNRSSTLAYHPQQQHQIQHQTYYPNQHHLLHHQHNHHLPSSNSMSPSHQNNHLQSHHQQPQDQQNRDQQQQQQQ
ncbi:hypothetical protein MJO28_009296 [Puccinia striiformis f. sp. tritici]|uniref:Uncharacterized protein n=1 Tax=Puccinia striiformis f. sp. tritici TaxID=168172 RepID=A0ACC0E7D2_9BASI|nr:hypothetical protein MJO28_009296 [Puccinia striiformis f. sp. tritici]KAI9615843.1 hypothetical protein H4Q26_011094 [Puccinia striiformis f. sp. tritici PST-130]